MHLLTSLCPQQRRASRLLCAYESTSEHSFGAIRVERVTTPERALDVMAFRSHSIRGGDGEEPSPTAATDARASLFLSKKTTESIGNMEREGEGIVQFVALSGRADFSRSTGGGVVVGAADAKFVEAARALTFQLPARVHVENLRVHAKARRLGIGTALLSAVVRYAREETVADMVTLKVEPDNRGAVDLYLKEGFFFYEDVHVGFMAKILE